MELNDYCSLLSGDKCSSELPIGRKVCLENKEYALNDGNICMYRKNEHNVESECKEIKPLVECACYDVKQNLKPVKYIGLNIINEGTIDDRRFINAIFEENKLTLQKNSIINGTENFEFKCTQKGCEIKICKKDYIKYMLGSKTKRENLKFANEIIKRISDCKELENDMEKIINIDNIDITKIFELSSENFTHAYKRGPVKVFERNVLI